MLTKETVLRQNSKQSTIKFSFVSTELIRLLTCTGLNDVSLIEYGKGKMKFLRSLTFYSVFFLFKLFCAVTRRIWLRQKPMFHEAPCIFEEAFAHFCEGRIFWIGTSRHLHHSIVNSRKALRTPNEGTS